MASNPLSAKSLQQAMSTVLPEAQTSLKNVFEAIALTAHAIMTSLDYKLVGLDEDDTLPSRDSLELPDTWCSGSSYAFQYSHPQSSLKFIMRISRLGTKALLHGIAPGDDKTASFEVVASEFLDTSKFPLSINHCSTGQELSSASQVFLSDGRLADFAKLFKVSIVQKLTPALWKEGYEESESSAASRQDTSGTPSSQPTRPLRGPAFEPPRPHPLNDPLAIGGPRRPFPDFAPPGFENEHEVGLPGRGGPAFGGRNPLNIGEGDLYPPGLGPHDPLRPNFGPQGGLGGGMGGGMHPTFDDPLFHPGPGFQGGPRGGPANPPGARYDPVGPGDPPQDPRAGSRFPGGGLGGRPPNPFGGYGDGDFI
ncbi:MAG: hypothetical protein M1814_003275 [Vezdaea aestivalis]|nr:MAG: hypothetical protein M1814_003275 [Vezdaea aestivalis]